MTEQDIPHTCKNCQFYIGVCIGPFYGQEVSPDDSCDQWHLSFAAYQDLKSAE